MSKRVSLLAFFVFSARLEQLARYTDDAAALLISQSFSLRREPSQHRRDVCLFFRTISWSNTKESGGEVWLRSFHILGAADLAPTRNGVLSFYPYLIAVSILLPTRCSADSLYPFRFFADVATPLARVLVLR